MLKPMIGRNSPLDRVSRRRGLTRPGSRTDAPAKAGRAQARLTPEEERLVKQILEEPMDYIDSEEFYGAMAPRPGSTTRRRPSRSPTSPGTARSWTDFISGRERETRSRSTGTVLLTGAEERVLFLQYNYARHRVSRDPEADRQADARPTSTPAKCFRWYRIAERYREQIAETNLALVLAMAKRTRMSEVDFADLVSEGNMALLRSVDKFDCGRGFKFSTYACRAILKAFSRQGMKLSKYRQRFPTDFDPAMREVEPPRDGAGDP